MTPKELARSIIDKIVKLEVQRSILMSGLSQLCLPDRPVPYTEWLADEQLLRSTEEIARGRLSLFLRQLESAPDSSQAMLELLASLEI